MSQTQKYLNLTDVEDLVSYCMNEFKLNQRVNIEFNHRFTRKMGQAKGNNRLGLYTVRLSVPLFMRATEEDRENTIIHEVAHIITFILYPKATPHGREWQMVHRKLGKEPSRCHTIDRTGLSRKVATVKCKCKCRVWEVTKTLYTRRTKVLNIVGMCPKCKTHVVKE